MAILKLTSEIVNSDSKVFLAWDGFESTSSDDIVRFIESIAPEDNKIDIRINCPGGDVVEGWRMYDSLRQSGKEISVIVEGMCASMATVILMAAPKERRLAYQNAGFCIHNPEACWLSADQYERLTADNIDAVADKLKLQASQLREQQQKILDLYVERTGTDAETLQKLMDEDVIINSTKAKELGLISDTLAPNTASKKNNINNYPMSKDKVEVGKSWLDRLLSKAGFKTAEDVKFNDLTFTAADGTSFSVEREEGLYAIGDAASPDGKYVMEDGSTVDINGGKINDIIPAKVELKNPENGDVLGDEEAQQLINTLYSKVKELESSNEQKKVEDEEASAKLNEAIAKISELEQNKISDEQKTMLDSINNAGGKEWFDRMMAMQSHGEPHIPQTEVDHNIVTNKKIGDGFIADEAKKSNRFRK